MSAQETNRQPRIEPAPNTDTLVEIKLAFFIAAVMCVSSALVGIRGGNDIGGLIALGMGALSTLAGLRA